MSQHILTYGTSLSAERTWFWRRTGGFWVTRIRAALEKRERGACRVTNRARWGVNSDWGLRHLHSRVLSLDPDLVSIEFAVNDADRRREVPIARSRTNLERMIDAIDERLPACEIVLLTTNPVYGRHRSDRPRLEDYYQVVREIAVERGLGLIDLHAAWTLALVNEESRLALLPDGIHPSEYGCDMVIVPKVLDAFRLREEGDLRADSRQ